MSIKKVELYFQKSYEREALFLPSGRLALYLAFTEWLRPGNRLLISPLNCDAVLFSILAAGLIPVFGPINQTTGNLDPTQIKEQDWKIIDAVITNNLYGIPDRMDIISEKCKKYNLVLIEDACQAFDSYFNEQRIGNFGDISIFSLSKQIQGIGAVLTFKDGSRKDSLKKRAQELLEIPPRLQKFNYLSRLVIKESLKKVGIEKILNQYQKSILPEKKGHRLPCDWNNISRLSKKNGGIEDFDPFLRANFSNYRKVVSPIEAKFTFCELKNFEKNRMEIIQGIKKLLNLGLVPPNIEIPTNFPIYRVPFFVKEREKLLNTFLKSGLKIDVIYDPPLNEYVPAELGIKLSNNSNAKIWSKNVFPVNPIFADEFIRLIKNIPSVRPVLS